MRKLEFVRGDSRVVVDRYKVESYVITKVGEDYSVRLYMLSGKSFRFELDGAGYELLFQSMNDFDYNSDPEFNRSLIEVSSVEI